MSHKLPDMLNGTIEKIKQMVDANSVIGEPITTPEGVTIIPISHISVGVGGGGSDFVSKHPNKGENPFGGGMAAGVKVVPVAFLIIKDGVVRMLPVALPASTTTDRIIEMIPSTLDQVISVIDSHLPKKDQEK